MNKKSLIGASLIALALVAIVFYCLSGKDGNRRPIPEEVLKQIQADDQVIRREIIKYEWHGDVLHMTTRVISGPLSGHYFELIAVKTSKGWLLTNVGRRSP